MKIVGQEIEFVVVLWCRFGRAIAIHKIPDVMIAQGPLVLERFYLDDARLAAQRVKSARIAATSDA